MSLAWGLAAAALVVGIVLFALGKGWVRWSEPCPPIRVTWSVQVGAETWRYSAQLIGDVWAVHTDLGDGGLFETIENAREWMSRDIHRRISARW